MFAHECMQAQAPFRNKYRAVLVWLCYVFDGADSAPFAARGTRQNSASSCFPRGKGLDLGLTLASMGMYFIGESQPNLGWEVCASGP